MSTQIQLRRGTAGEWTTANPILAHGEIGIEMSDPPSFKVGDGATVWADLPYSASGGGGGGGDMLKADNLSGLANYTTARSNLGLGTAATTAATAYATAAQGATADAAVPKTLVDAKGDLLVASAADTLARLPIGADAHVLTADAAEVAGVKWAPTTPSAAASLLAQITLR